MSLLPMPCEQGASSSILVWSCDCSCFPTGQEPRWTSNVLSLLYSPASWGVCSASRHWCSSQIACPYFQCHSSKGFHHRYLDPLVGHRDNHTELRPEMVSFCERYGYSIQMACPYRPCHLSKGLDHPYSYALDRKSRRTKACNRQLLRKKSDRQRETCSSWVFSSR